MEPGQQQRLWQQAAPHYDRSMQWLERRWLGQLRATLIGEARGDCVEVGIGTGVNVGWYPPQVRLIGVDSSSRMIELAGDRARRLGREVSLEVGSADQLKVADGSLDTVVATLLLCSVPAVETTLAEFARVLRPGGRLILIDHVESSAGLVRLGQRLADRVTRATGECWRRRPVLQLPAAGFRPTRVIATRARLFEAVLAERA